MQSTFSFASRETFPLFDRVFIYKRYFETDHALQSHWKGKVHKRRCKALKEPAYTIEEAELAAGLGRENHRPSTRDQPVKDVQMT